MVIIEEPSNKYTKRARTAAFIFIIIAAVMIPLTAIAINRARKKAPFTYIKHQLALTMVFAICVGITGIVWLFPATYL